MNSERIKYFDIAKGMLIILVILVHISLYFGYCPDPPGNYNMVFSCIVGYLIYFFVPYAMPAFFVIHGYFTKKNRSFFDECKNAALSLLFPMVILMPGISFWFCWAMFFSIIIYNMIRKINSTVVRFSIVIILSFIGIFLSNHSIDHLYFDRALAFLPFLFLGENCRSICDSTIAGIVGTIIYVIITIFLIRSTQLDINQILVYFPFTKDFSQHFLPPNINGVELMIYSLKDIPLFYILAISGSLGILFLAKMIRSSKILEYIGRNSLGFCLIHLYLLEKIVAHIPISAWITGFSNDILLSIVLYLSSFLFLLLISTLTCKIIGKYFPWIFGKGIIR